MMDSQDDEVRDSVHAELQPVPLTGNREMAEEAERAPCASCKRSFAPSVLARHQPICEARVAKDKLRQEERQRHEKNIQRQETPDAENPDDDLARSLEMSAISSAASVEQLTPTAGRIKLASLRPAVDAKTDLARARGANAGVGEPSRMPCGGDAGGPPAIFVGSG